MNTKMSTSSTTVDISDDKIKDGFELKRNVMTEDELMNLPRKERRRLGKIYGIKIPGIQDYITKKKDE